MNAMPRLFAIAALGAVALPAQKSVEDVLPASTYASVRFAGLEELQRVASEQGLGRLGLGIKQRVDPDVWDQHVGSMLDRAAQELQDALDGIRLTPAASRSILSRPVAFGVGRMVYFDDSFQPSMTLVVDMGNEATTIRKVLVQLEDLLTSNGSLSAEGLEIGQHGMRRIRHDSRSGEVVLGTFGNFAVVSNSSYYVRECVEVAEGQRPPLAQHSALGQMRGLLPNEPMLSGFMNTAPLAKASQLLEPMLPYPMTGLFDAIGASGLTGVYVATAADGDGAVDLLHIGLEGNPEGLAKAALARPVDMRSARYCSPDTIVYGALALDAPAFIGAFDRLVTMLPPDVQEEVNEEFWGELDEELRDAGLDLEQLHALLGNIGPSWSFAVELPPTMPIPVLHVFVDVKDPAALEPYLAALRDESDSEWKTIAARQEGDADIHYTSVDVGVTLRPGYAFHDGMLMLSSNTPALRTALRRVARGDETLLSTADFREVAEAHRGASGMLHSRNAHGVHMGWKTLEPFMRGQLDGEMGAEFGIDAGIMPTAEEMADAVGTSTWSLHVTEHGITLKQRSNLGLGTILSLLGVGANEVLDRAAGKIY